MTKGGSKGNSGDHLKSTNSEPPRVVHTKLILFAFSCFLILDHFTRDYLFNLSIQHQILIRSQYATPFVDKLARVISELGDKYLVGAFIYLSFHLLDQTKSFIVMLVAVISQSFSCVLKGMYHEARPFFMAEIKPNGCRFEYGNPSGHAILATGLYLTMWDLFSRQYKVPKTLKLLSLIPLIAFMLILGASRIYNGVHTYNQVLSGYAWGLLSYSCLCHIFYYDIFMLIQTIKSRTLKQLAWNPMIQGFLVSNLMAIGIYFWNVKMNPIPSEWTAFISRNCSSLESAQSDVELHNFIHFQFSWAFIGAYLGLIVDHRYLKTSDTFFETSLVTTFKRLMLCIPICVLTQLPMLLISKKASFVVVVIFKTMLPTMSGNFYIFGLNKWLSTKFGVSNNKKIKQ